MRHIGNPLSRWSLRLAGAYLAFSVLAGVAVAELTLHPHRRPLRHAAEITREARDDFGASLREVEVTAADGARLRGSYVVPRDDNGSVVVLLHGVADNREGVWGFARLFLARGYRTLLVDSRAHGVSEGAVATYGLLERHDVHAWVSWLYAHEPPRCVFGFGESMGAAIMVQAVATEPRLCAVAVESASSTFREVAFERVGYHVGLGPWFGRTVARLPVMVAELYVRARYGLELLAANPAEALRGSTIPALLIHGTADRNILPWHQGALAQAQPAAGVWLVPGAVHGGARAVNPGEFDRRVLGCFEAHGGGAPARE